MTDPDSTLIVLIDADDVQYTFADWPDHICLAVCLHRDGECSMVVFRREERAEIPERLLQMLALAPTNVAFVPEVRGFRTWQFRYSDERRLIALVASDPSVLDDAVDYAVNYNYALEEGLDPAVVLGRTPLKPKPASKPKPVRRPQAKIPRNVEPMPAPPAAPQTRDRGELSPLLPDFLRQSATLTSRPKFASVRRPIGQLRAS